MILATKLSVANKVCSPMTLNIIRKIYTNNYLDFTYKKYNDQKSILKLIPYLKNDKKNNDKKINFILLKKIGKTLLPNKSKISLNKLKKMSRDISLC